jgi:hypothetical protein
MYLSSVHYSYCTENYPKRFVLTKSCLIGMLGAGDDCRRQRADEGKCTTRLQVFACERHLDKAS